MGSRKSLLTVIIENIHSELIIKKVILKIATMYLIYKENLKLKKETFQLEINLIIGNLKNLTMH